MSICNHIPSYKELVNLKRAHESACGDTTLVTYNNFLSSQFNVISISKIKNNLKPLKKKKVVSTEKKYREKVDKLIVECMNQLIQYKSELTEKIIGLCTSTFYEINSNISLVECFDTHIYKFLIKEVHTLRLAAARNKLEEIEKTMSKFMIISDILHSLPEYSDSIVKFNFAELFPETDVKSDKLKFHAMDVKILEYREKIEKDNSSNYFIVSKFYQSNDISKLDFSDIIEYSKAHAKSSDEYITILDEIISTAWQQTEYPFSGSREIKLDNIKDRKLKEIIIDETDDCKVKDLNGSWEFYKVVETMEDINFEINPRNMINILWDATVLIPGLLKNNEAGFDQIFPIFAIAFCITNIENKQSVINYILNFAKSCGLSSKASFIATYLETLCCLADNFN